MSEPLENVILGRLGAPYGVKGWLKIHSFTDNAEDIFALSPWILGDQKSGKQLTVSKWRSHNNGLIVKFEEIEDRTQAEALVGLEISVLPEQLPDLPEDEFYWRDLIGMQVVTDKGYDLGVVTGLMETGSNDVLQVKANSKDAFGKRERLIPFLDGQVIKNVDLVQKRIEVDWEPGF
ncbi:MULTISPECIES: ribosome maturation factor RimM [Corallincola]|uniref:Ribosome maturation factor RimM n=2 Tax=Corallincola TaxID=1775176 RepID=A0ABY1WS35_9GAMM|nr:MULTISPECIES: ribosome maturation factor RimM [Corallincola]TAA47388.1 ribosome maturation factor RimM [Corallincola spongiicola]TCI05061.1 ribosome maturation factor RimM [Corallincola luteus]